MIVANREPYRPLSDKTSTMISRRCLICSNINPCAVHGEQEQEAELRRNKAAIAALSGTAT